MHYLDSDFGYEDFDGYIEENKWALTLVLVRHAYQMWALTRRLLPLCHCALSWAWNTGREEQTRHFI
jgi:hypothetical protein